MSSHNKKAVEIVMDIFTGSPRKIPRVMIVIFILTFLFPSEAAMIRDIIVSMIQVFYPVHLWNNGQN